MPIWRLHILDKVPPELSGCQTGPFLSLSPVSLSEIPSGLTLQ